MGVVSMVVRRKLRRYERLPSGHRWSVVGERVPPSTRLARTYVDQSTG